VAWQSHTRTWVSKSVDGRCACRNTTTDIRAYVASGIPLERIFMIGPHGGKAGTVKIDNFTDHIPHIFEYPDATTPIPYTELLFTAVPGYKVKKVVKGEHATTLRVPLLPLNQSRQHPYTLHYDTVSYFLFCLLVFTAVPRHNVKKGVEVKLATVLRVSPPLTPFPPMTCWLHLSQPNLDATVKTIFASCPPPLPPIVCCVGRSLASDLGHMASHPPPTPPTMVKSRFVAWEVTCAFGVCRAGRQVCALGQY